MHINLYLFIITILLFNSVSTNDDVCTRQTCSCNQELTLIHCDSRKWQNLDAIEFPVDVRTLTLNDNNLKFDTISDRNKIEKLSNLINLSINKNPLVNIPSFNQTKIQFLALQNTSITSAEFPSSYANSVLQTISLKNNLIRTIKQNDFSMLANSSLNKLNLDDASISTIDHQAFHLLTKLQSLSLSNNLLQTCDYLLNLPVLSSIHLDGNRFTSLPDELSMPGKIKTYFFRYNRISTIDETSALNNWLKNNRTDIQIYLANNSLDCCSSIWFVRFLKIARHFVADASLLTCVSPADYAGKLLTELDPNRMTCNGPNPNHSWWSTGKIIGLIICSLVVIAAIVIAIVFYLRFRNHPSRSSYRAIGGNDNESLYRNFDPTIPRGPAFQTDEDDGYDTISSSAYGCNILSGPPSEAPTRHTAEGDYANDDNHVEGIGIEEEAHIPSDY